MPADIKVSWNYVTPSSHPQGTDSRCVKGSEISIAVGRGNGDLYRKAHDEAHVPLGPRSKTPQFD